MSCTYNKYMDQRHRTWETVSRRWAEIEVGDLPCRSVWSASHGPVHQHRLWLRSHEQEFECPWSWLIANVVDLTLREHMDVAIRGRCEEVVKPSFSHSDSQILVRDQHCRSYRENRQLCVWRCLRLTQANVFDWRGAAGDKRRCSLPKVVLTNS